MVPKLLKIARNRQISEFTGSRLGQSKRNFQARLSYLKKYIENHNMNQQNTKMLFLLKKSLRSKMPYTKIVKNEKLNIIQLNLIEINYLQ